MPTNVESYRAFRSPWLAVPSGVPDIATEGDAVGGAAVYVSCNGATEVKGWQVLTGTDRRSLEDSGSVPKGGFETAITVHPNGRVPCGAVAWTRTAPCWRPSKVVTLPS